MICYLIIIVLIVLFIVFITNIDPFIPSVEKEDLNNYTGTILYNNNVNTNKNINNFINIGDNTTRTLSKDVTFVDRYKDKICEDNTYKYCYDGSLNITDILDNKLIKEVDVNTYLFGKSYNVFNNEFKNKKMSLNDYIIPARNINHLTGSSLTRDEVTYDISIKCNTTKPWKFSDQCYSSEAEASYYYDKTYYEEKNITKYPFDKEPINPVNSNYYNSDKYKVFYDEKIWDLQNRPIKYDLEKCDKETPFFWENKCYNDLFTSDNCKIINSTEEKEVPCIELKHLGNENLYNNITNNFIGDLQYGDYAHISCDNSGVLTECINEDKVKKEGNHIIIENVEKNTYDHILDNNQLLYNVGDYKSVLFVKDHYIETNPHAFYENYNKNFINGINENSLPNETSFFIQCKTNYNEKGEYPCPKHLPLCEGNIDGIQTGVCKETLDNQETIGTYETNSLTCINNHDCPYNFPICNNNICTHNTTKKRINTTGALNDKFNYRL